MVFIIKIWKLMWDYSKGLSFVARTGTQACMLVLSAVGLVVGGVCAVAVLVNVFGKHVAFIVFIIMMVWLWLMAMEMTK